MDIERRELLLLGASELECHEVMPQIEQAIHEVNANISIRCITNREILDSFGITQTPAIVSIDYQVISQGIVPSVEDLKQWIQSIEKMEKKRNLL